MHGKMSSAYCPADPGWQLSSCGHELRRLSDISRDPASRIQPKYRRPTMTTQLTGQSTASRACKAGGRAISHQAIGALALGALGFGALAIGTLAIGWLSIGRARIGKLEIDELSVRSLRVTEALHLPPESGSDK